MSNTIKPHSCETIRDMVYNYRRGELSELDAALFEDTIASCPSCGRYANRIMGMLDSVNEVSPEDYLGQEISPEFKDDLFSSIMANIDSPESTELVDGEMEQVNLHEPDVDTRTASSRAVVQLDDYMRGVKPDSELDEDDFFHTSSSRLTRFTMFAAAALLTVIGGAYFWSTQSPIEHDEPSHLAFAPDDGDMVDNARDIKHLQAFDGMRLEKKTPDAVKVFASNEASWRIEESTPGGYTLHLEQGTILVEFLPTKREKLQVISHDTRVNVVGTVFYVSAQDEHDEKNARVGVLTGKVRVKPAPEQPVVELEDGQQLQEDARISQVPDGTVERSKTMIDLEAHRAILKARARKAPEQQDTQREPEVRVAEKRAPVQNVKSKQVVADKSLSPAAQDSATPDDPVTRLQAEAKQALRDKDYSHATRKIEELLEVLPASHPERATYRLELARLFVRNSGKREEAIKQLRIFISEHPTDVAAPSARRQMCRLLGSRSAQDAECNKMDDL